MDLEVGTTCNNECRFCSAAGTPGRFDLSFEKIAESLRERPDRNDSFLIITGGEPTIRPDLMEIISTASSSGFTEILLQTNGRRLRDPDYAGGLARAAGLRLLISIHGHTPEIHDESTKVPGSFRETLEGISNALRLGIDVSTLTVITRSNFSSLPDMTLFLMKMGIKTINFAFPMICGRTEANFKEVVPSYSESAPFVHRAFALIERDASMKTPSIQDWPFCFARGLEKYVNEINYPERPLIYVTGSYVDEITERLKLKTKNPSCAGCIYFEICEGFQTGYARQMGTGEFVPVKERNEEAAVKDVVLGISGSSYPVLNEECWFNGRAFGGFLILTDGADVVPLTAKGRGLISFLDGLHPVSEIRSLFGEKSLTFMLYLNSRGFISMQQEPFHPPYIEDLKRAILPSGGRMPVAGHVWDEDGDFELPLYNPWPERITPSYRE
jgi:MoaA/NifB/PqqE/SkfB family radical SAM enzyme